MENSNGKLSYSIGLDNAQLQQDADQAARILSNIGEGAERESAAVREALTNLPEINIEIITNASSTVETIDAAFAEIDRVFNENESAIVQLEKEYERLKKAAANAFNKGDNKAYRELLNQANAVRQVIATRKNMNKEVAKTADALAAEERRVKEQTSEIQKNEQAHTSLRQRLKEVKMELVEMEAAGQRGTVEYRALQEEAAKLTDAWGDAQAQANILANDQRGLQGVISGLSGVSGAFAAAQGAVGLFAGENEELQGIMLKVQSLMAITMGLQQVQQTLNKDSAFSLVTLNSLKKIWNKLLGESVTKTEAENVVTAVNTTAQGANTVATVADTAAQQANNNTTITGTQVTAANTGATNRATGATIAQTVATRAASLALKGLKMALISTGIGALIVAVGELVGLLMRLFGAASKADEEFKEQQEILAKGREAYIKTSLEIENYKTRIDTFNGSQQQEKALIKELNSKFGEQLGYYKSLAEWKQVLTDKGDAYCQMLMQEAQISALASKAAELYVKKMELADQLKTKRYEHSWFQSDAADEADLREEIKEIDDKNKRISEEIKRLTSISQDIRSQFQIGGHIDPSSVNSNSGNGKAYDPKKAAAEIQKALDEYKAARAKYIKDTDEELTNLTIDAQEQGLTRELNEIRRNTRKKLEAWNEQLEKLAEARKETAKAQYMNQRGATEEGWSNTTAGKYTTKDWIEVIKKESPSVIAEFDRVWAKISANGELAIKKAQEKYNDALVDEYGTLQEKEAKLLREWSKKLDTIPAEYLPAAMKKMEAEFASLGSDAFKKAINWDSVFGDMGTQSVEVLKYNLEKVRAYFKRNKDAMSVSEIKDYQEAITKMETEIAARSPFASLQKSLEDLGRAKTEYINSLKDWKTAQESLNEANRAFVEALKERNDVQTQIDNGELVKDCIELAEAEERLKDARQKIAVATERTNAAEQRTLKSRNDITSAYKGFANSLRNVGGVIVSVGEQSKELASVFSSTLANAISKAIGFTDEIIKATSSVISSVGDVGKKVASGITTAVEASASGSIAAAAAGATAISMIEKASVILAVISAAIQVATAVANLLNNDDDLQEDIEKRVNEINNLKWELEHPEEMQLTKTSGSGMDILKQKISEAREELAKLNEAGKNLNAWQYMYQNSIENAELYGKTVNKIADYWANVEYTANKALGVERYNKAREQLENLAAQQVKIYQNIRDENAKKKKDAGKIDEYNKEIDELKNKMADVVNEIVEDIIGRTAVDLASELGNAFYDAVQQGEDAMEAWHKKVNDIVADIIKRMLIQEYLEPQIGKIFNDYKKEWFEDGKFRGMDAVKNSAQDMARRLNDAGEVFNQIYNGLSQGLQDIFQTTKDAANREASQKGIATASQESVDELNGRATAIQGHTYSIAESTRQLANTSNLILESVLNIETVTTTAGERLGRMETTLRNVQNAVEDISLHGVRLA